MLLPGVGVVPEPERVEVEREDLLVVSEVGRVDPETEGRPAKTTELISGVQLDEAGTRAVKGIEVMGPRLSAG